VEYMYLNVGWPCAWPTVRRLGVHCSFELKKRPVQLMYAGILLQRRWG